MDSQLGELHENTNNTTEKKSPKKIIAPIVGSLLLLAALLFAYKKITYAMHNEDTENSQIECNIVPIAPRVQGYVSTIFDKLEVADRTQAALYAVEHGLLKPK